VVSGPVAERAREVLAPVRDLFAAAFFVFFGLSIDAGAIPSVLLPALGLAVLTIPTKLLSGWWAAKRIGAGIPGRLRAGTVLIARGEFSIVIAGLGVGVAGVDSELGPLAATYVLATALIGSIVTRWSDELARLVPARLAVAPATRTT
jgi:CPA2 family monovalent cation:H+ antiporter-2